MRLDPLPSMRQAGSAFLLIGGLAWPLVAGAEPAPHRTGERQVTLTGDNDFFAGHDHHYTNGLQFAISADEMALPAFVRTLPALRSASERRVTLSLGQRIHTPTDKTRASPDPTDRPYAGWLYAMAEVSARNGAAVDSIQASVGVVGPAAMARQTQNTYHAIIGANKAQGWDKQLDNEPAFMVGIERAWPSYLKTGIGPLSVDVAPKVGVTIGTVYTYANAGAVLRLGRNLPDDFATTDVSLGPPRDGYRPVAADVGWYAWLGTDVRAVAWNTFIDGNLSGGGPRVDRKPFGFDLQAGLAMTWNRSRLGFSVVRRSKEFKAQSGADTFGQITYSFAH